MARRGRGGATRLGSRRRRVFSGKGARRRRCPAGNPSGDGAARSQELHTVRGRKRGAHRTLIVQWLLIAAEEPWDYGDNGRRTYFANLPRRAHWIEDELGELDGRRVRDRWSMLYEGAEFLERFGAFLCINCETPLAPNARYEYGPLSSRRSRRYHCDGCKSRLGSVTRSQVEAIRKVLDVSTDQRRLRRTARRAA